MLYISKKKEKYLMECIKNLEKAYNVIIEEKRYGTIGPFERDMALAQVSVMASSIKRELKTDTKIKDILKNAVNRVWHG